MRFGNRRAATGAAAAAIVSLAGVAGAEMRSVRVKAANFRAGPSTGHQVLFKADRYYPVEVLACSAGWCKTRDFEGDVAWVSEPLLGDQSSVVVHVDRANLRTKPTTSAAIRFRVDWGEALKVLLRRGDWLQVEDIDGESGWIHAPLTWGWVDETPAEGG